MIRSFAVLFACLVATSCTAVNSTGANGQSVLPNMADADYSVDIELGDTQALLGATFEPPGTIGQEIKFTNGESIAVNGTPLVEGDLLGVTYSAEAPLLEPGTNYTFVLNVPGKGSFSRSIEMLASAKFTGPAAGTSFATSGSVSITWSGSDPNGSDEVDVDFSPNGDGKEATATLNALPGGTTVGLSSVELTSLYKAATGTAGGTALGTLTLKRSHSEPIGGPFAGGTAEFSWALDQVAVKIQAE